MADAAYDAIIVGAGNKGLVTAMYLAKYGGMDVALFEERNEAGGGWGSKESCAPGFMHDYCSTLHSAFHHVPLFEDFPDFKERGGKLASHKGAGAIIFGEDHSCLVFYGEEHDPDQELTAKSIADFSERMP